MKKIFLFFIMLFFIKSSFSQQVIVVDKTNNQPLEGVVIFSDEPKVSALTNSEGSAKISLFIQSDKIIFQRAGYQKLNLSYKDIVILDFKILMEPKAYNLGEVIVQGINNKESLVKNPGSFEMISPRDYYRTNDMFLQNTLNMVPGVKMEVRSSTSQSHILIRGLGGKSRFSMRDINVYYNGIPLTDADGTTNIDFLDFTSFGNTQIIKGPSSILYGASPGGAIVFYTKKAHFLEMDLNEIFLTGSDGLIRSNTNYRAGTENANLYGSYGYQNYDGYREHSSSQKRYFNFSGDFFPSEKQTVSVLFNYTKVNDQFPGEVDINSYKNSPELANQVYIDKNIGIISDNYLAGISHIYNFTPLLENTTSIFVGHSFGKQPIEPFYNRLTTTKAGARSVFSYSPIISDVQTNFIFGGEFIKNFNIERHYAISQEGMPLSINSDKELNLSSSNIFGQVSIDILNNTSLNAGARVNWVDYKIQDLLKSNNMDFSGERKIDPVITPVISLIHRQTKDISLYALYSNGFSAPTVSEISVQDGSINLDLNPEKTSNFEIGSNGSLFNNKLEYKVSLFYSIIKESFVPQRVNGFTYYVNAGKSTDKGAEIYLSYKMIDNDNSFLKTVRPFISYSYTNYMYENYSLNGVDYSGNDVPGISPSLFNAGLDIITDPGFYLYLSYNYVDKRAITDDNLVYDDPYSLLNMKFGWRKRLAKIFTLQIFGGVDNTLNTLYSPILAVNQRIVPNELPVYYNPAPARNFYGAVNIEFHF